MATLPHAESVHSTAPSERFAIAYQKASGEKEVLHVTDSPDKAMASFAAVARPESAISAMMQAGDSVALQDRELQLESGWVAEKNGIYQAKFVKPEARAAYEVERARIDSPPSPSPNITLNGDPAPVQALVGEITSGAADQKPGKIVPDDLPGKLGLSGASTAVPLAYDVDKSGVVTYKSGTSKLVTDAPKGVRVLDQSPEAYALAVKVAVTRYGSNITLNGDPAFVEGMMSAAKESGLKLTINHGKQVTELERKVVTPAPESPSREAPDQWENFQSIDGAAMRANHLTRMAEIRVGGEVSNVTGLAAIDSWCKEHHISGADQQRLVALDIAAGKTPLRNETTDTPKDNDMATKKPGALDPVEVVAPSAQSEKQQEFAEAKKIGANMDRPDWQETMNLLKAKAPNDPCRVYIPKAGAEYTGQMLLATDTHIVQRVGRGTAVAHDISKLDNGPALGDQVDKGTLRPGAQMTFKYGPERGEGAVTPFQQQRASEVNKELTAWAEKNITNTKGREAFIKHVEAATKEMSQPKQQRPRTMSAPPLAPARGPTRDR